MASKWNPTHVANGEEYSRPQVGKEISKSAMAQCARRERERILKQSIAPQTEHLLRDTRRFTQLNSLLSIY
ncbi:hypothetical protein RHGRI_001050 [Rhododendron griersonianum]|uniref:Uncharacterized protein n=1 Tax=Rhododendron griersonianum TaxID=479676 RepID=A0AAV6LLC0_9ERIC|nr:hypothetical protein RHGRI_027256 [Rhododendron griersonianum]KAG5565038.1 hypothetical protein RHGRI_001050 [Rhododendron griersonianum]